MMSKSKYYWFFHVKRTIEQYPDGLTDGTVQSCIAKGAIDNALSDTRKMKDGEERIKLIDMVYFKKTHTVDGAASRLYVSERTARRWSQNFVYKVAEKMGYL